MGDLSYEKVLKLLNDIAARLDARPTTRPLVASLPEAALLLNVSVATMWRLVAARQIESVMVGQSRKIRMREIERYLEDNAIPARKAIQWR